MKKIYIVEGRTGSYDDTHQWVVRAFPTKQEADNFAAQCNSRADEICAILSKAGLRSYEWDDTALPNIFDPQMQLIDDYAAYVVAEIDWGPLE